MDQFLQQLVNGLSIGAIYALMAVGYSLVYSIMNFSNFAHGSVIMLGAYFGFFALTAPRGALRRGVLIAACGYRGGRRDPRAAGLQAAPGPPRPVPVLHHHRHGRVHLHRQLGDRHHRPHPQDLPETGFRPSSGRTRSMGAALMWAGWISPSSWWPSSAWRCWCCSSTSPSWARPSRPPPTISRPRPHGHQPDFVSSWCSPSAAAWPACAGVLYGMKVPGVPPDERHHAQVLHRRGVRRPGQPPGRPARLRCSWPSSRPSSRATCRPGPGTCSRSSSSSRCSSSAPSGIMGRDAKDKA